MSDSTPITSALSSRDFASTADVRAAVRREIEPIHRARDVDVAVRIERTHELLRVRFEIALNRELGRKWLVAPQLRRDRLPAEPLPPFRRRAIRHHAEHARDAHAGGGRTIGSVIAVLATAGRAGSPRAESSAARSRTAKRPRCRKCRSAAAPRPETARCRPARPCRRAMGPITRIQPLDAERCAPLRSRRARCPRPTDPGKLKRYGLPVAGSIDAGPGRAEETAQRIDADDEVAPGVDGLARPDHLLPPALARICRRRRRVRGRRKPGEQAASHCCDPCSARPRSRTRRARRAARRPDTSGTDRAAGRTAAHRRMSACAAFKAPDRRLR